MKTVNLIPFPSGPYEVDDGVGDGRPLLALLSYDAATVRPDALRVPELVERIFYGKCPDARRAESKV